MSSTVRNILFLGFLFFALLGKGQMLPISDHQLIETSENIIRGKVISSEARWVNNGKYIYTFIKVKVNDVLAGNEQKGQILTIVTPGGYDPVKDLGMRVSHQAEFENGEDCILFLAEAKGELDAIDYRFLKNEPLLPSKIMRVNGYFQGKHKIFTDPTTQKIMILKANENRIEEFDLHQKELKQELKHVQVK